MPQFALHPQGLHHSGPLYFCTISLLCKGSTLFRTPRSAVVAAAVAPIAGCSTHIGMPVTTERRTWLRGAPRCSSSSGRTTTASLACRIPRVKLAQACSSPSAAPPGCRKSEAPRSTAVQASACAKGLSPDSAGSRGLPAAAAAGPCVCSCRHVFMYSRADCVPTKIRSVRSMLSTVTCLRKETRPRRIVRETRCVPPPVRYVFSGSSTISAKPPPMLAKDLIGVTPVSDRRICVRLRSALQALMTWAISWFNPLTQLTETLRKAI
mmetsp:Transcript_82996/g.256600  ORF Transcript_82996/g.256600 Transcript_82996/m.256600 type:complete len:266 (-) Transcript_82996:778-1575(-)